MKKFLTLALLLIFLVGLLAVLTTNKVEKSSNNTLSPKEVLEPATTLVNNTYQISSEFSEDGYEVNWIIVEDVNKISLKSNLEEKLTAKEIVEKESCQHLVSGGFFTLENKHIGLFVSERKKISEAINSNLFNGYFYINKNGKAEISSSIPNFPKLALQSGPILVKNGIPQVLNIKNDEHARRIVVTTNKNEQVIFLAFYDTSNYVGGPTLSELPNVLADLEKNTSLDFENALNLDGGTHSTFISDAFSLTELSTIGSYFCIHN